MSSSSGAGFRTITHHSYGRFKSLDGLRAYAVVIVLIFHVDHKAGLIGGFIGVDVFFVLSGFLITSLLIGELETSGHLSLVAFYARRVLRLIPALVCAMVLAMILILLVPGLVHSAARHDTLVSLPAILFFVANWPAAFMHNAKDILTPTWSLAVEEQFYIVWPACFLFVFSRFRRMTATYLLGGCAFGVMIYSVVDLHRGWALDRIYFGTDTHCGGLLLGCALAFLLSTGRVPTTDVGRNVAKALCTAAVLLLLILTGLFSIYDGASLTVGVSLASISTAIILYVQIATPIAALEGFLESRPSRWIGVRSYGLYIWHYPIYQALFTITFIHDHPLVIGTVPCVSLSFIAAALSYRFVEQPVIRRWKGQFQRTEALPSAEQSATN